MRTESLTSARSLLWLQVLGFALTLAGTYPAIEAAYLRLNADDDGRPRRTEDYSEQIEGTFTRTQMSIFHPRRMRVGDEQLVLVRVEHYPDSPLPNCEPPALSAPSLKVTPQPENGEGRGGYVIASQTTGRKYLSVVLKCDGKVRIVADSFIDAYKNVDWLGRTAIIMQVIGIPTLIAVFVIHIRQQRKRRKRRHRDADSVQATAG